MNDNKEVKIHLSIKPTWSILKEVHEKTETFLKNKNFKIDFIEATIMCGAELVENAIKYGSEDEGHSIITFDLTTHEGEVVITVTNGIKDEKDALNVKTHIDKVKRTDDPGKLYTERLMELMENPKPGVSQLGLYRIAYEGEFKLDYIFKNKLLSVIAQRKY